MGQSALKPIIHVSMVLTWRHLGSPDICGHICNRWIDNGQRAGKFDLSSTDVLNLLRVSQIADRRPQGGVLGTFIPIYVAEGRSEAEITCEYLSRIDIHVLNTNVCANEQGL